MQRSSVLVRTGENAAKKKKKNKPTEILMGLQCHLILHPTGPLWVRKGHSSWSSLRDP